MEITIRRHCENIIESQSASSSTVSVQTHVPSGRVGAEMNDFHVREDTKRLQRSLTRIGTECTRHPTTFQWRGAAPER